MDSQKEKEEKEEGDYMDMSGLVFHLNKFYSSRNILWVRYANFICIGYIWIPSNC